MDYVDTWRALEDLQRNDLVKSIGVCNFNRRQIERLLRVATISPVINQVSTHSRLCGFTLHVRVSFPDRMSSLLESNEANGIL